MSKNVIFGSNVKVNLFVSGVFYPLFCGTDCTFKEEKESVEASTITSGGTKEFRLRMFSWSLDVTGLTKVDNADGQIAYFYLLQASVRMEIQTIQVIFTDDAGNSTQINGTAYILNSSITGPASNFSEANVTFLGTGIVDLSVVVGPGASSANILSDWWVTVNGNAFINGASATGSKAYTLQSTDIIKEVDVEGTNFDIVTGSPTGRQCQLDLANHKIIFPFTFDGTQTVFVLFERP